MIIGTAGHIDHGKSALVTALTGRPMDRLAEERRRGITIELGFAPLERAGQDPIGIVDVPGHEDFVRMMVAGASGIDLVLLVVDAQEGIRPQTLEHLAVAEQLRIPAGIPVLTKADLVSPEWLDLVRADLMERLAGSPIRFEEPAVVSALTGEGVAALRDRLLAYRELPGGARRAAHLLRLPIDRVFAVAGVGTVVTGTLWGGQLSVGETIRIEPGGRTARIRSLESFGVAVEQVTGESRVALGLVGPRRVEVERGQWIVGGGAPWQPTERFDAVLALLREAPRPLTTRTRLRVHHGTAEVLARAYPRAPVRPGESGPVRVVLEAPLLLCGGDRVVVRSYSPVTTIGGGWVADPEPPRRTGWPEGLGSEDPGERLVALVRRRSQGVPRDRLEVLSGRPAAEAEAALRARARVSEVAGRWLVQDRVNELEGMVEGAVDAWHHQHPDEPGIPLETLRSSLGSSTWAADAVLDSVIQAGRLRSAGSVVARAGFQAASGGEGDVQRILEALQTAGLEPPTIGELERLLGLRNVPATLRVLAGKGLVEAVERDRYYAAGTLDRVTKVLEEVGAGQAEIPPPAVRDRLGVSRKYLIPLLEWADRKGITRRDRDGRRYLVKVQGRRSKVE